MELRQGRSGVRARQGSIAGLSRPSPADAVVVVPGMDLAADVPTAVDPPASLLPVLTLAEAHDVLGVLAAVVIGGQVDVLAAEELLSNLASRVPPRG
ncbi:hypothetical protein ACWFRJ_42375 [Streptomyces sp. NPDC055239]